MLNWKDAPIPDRMKGLPRDKRGYPIPVIVLRDRQGKAHFTINDEAKRQWLIANDCCAICGLQLLRGRWFIGGPLSAFDENGAYIDPPTHGECAEYALKVCPYLAVSSYNKRIDAKTRPDIDPTTIFVDPTQDQTRPTMFVAVMAVKQMFHTQDGLVRYIKPRPKYRKVQFWQAGTEMSGDTGWDLLRDTTGITKDTAYGLQS